MELEGSLRVVRVPAHVDRVVDVVLVVVRDTGEGLRLPAALDFAFLPGEVGRRRAHRLRELVVLVLEQLPADVDVLFCDLGSLLVGPPLGGLLERDLLVSQTGLVHRHDVRQLELALESRERTSEDVVDDQLPESPSCRLRSRRRWTSS